VELGFLWANSDGSLRRSGHVVTVTGIDYDETGQNGAMNIIDPWGGVAISGNLTVGNNGGNSDLVLGYSGGAAGNPADTADNPTDAGNGAIAFATAESLVPEPTIAFGLVALAGLGVRGRSR
jgi:hypothetical protein